MIVAERAVDFIKRWEKFSPRAYWDVTRWSIGFGGPSYEGEKIGIHEAEARLRHLLEGFNEALQERLKIEATEAQKTALLSALFNLGTHGLDTNDSSGVFDLANRGDWRGAALKLQEYCNAGGKPLPGLVSRRKAEAELLVMSDRGDPRVMYSRTYFLMPSDATPAEFALVSAWAYTTRSTVGFSADDGGIGNLDKRTVILALGSKRHPMFIKDWYATHYPGVTVTEMTTFPTTTTVTVTPDTPTALVGLHGSADSSWGNPLLPKEAEMARTGRLEAFKLLSDEHPDSVRRLQEINPTMFIMVRLYAKFDGQGHDSASFLKRVLPQAKAFYDRGVRFMELHNEPNLVGEGMFQNWKNGIEFGNWFKNVAVGLRKAMPEIKIGYPGLSPGHAFNKRYDPIAFWKESSRALLIADWVGFHAYWTTEEDMLGEGGMGFQKYKTNKVKLITEFSNPASGVSKEIKAKQYVKYYSLLRGVHSAYSFVSSSSTSFAEETWEDSPIARIIGERENGIPS